MRSLDLEHGRDDEDLRNGSWERSDKAVLFDYFGTIVDTWFPQGVHRFVNLTNLVQMFLARR
jgi:hypothetical protein